ncbi:MAG: hypothetical protein V1876_01120 [Candidatus Peregrinibacteria bacterium]
MQFPRLTSVALGAGRARQLSPPALYHSLHVPRWVQGRSLGYRASADDAPHHPE